MTGKRQSKDNVSRTRRSAPDLGQKEAKLEKRAQKSSDIWKVVMSPNPHGSN